MVYWFGRTDFKSSRLKTFPPISGPILVWLLLPMVDTGLIGNTPGLSERFRWGSDINYPRMLSVCG